MKIDPGNYEACLGRIAAAGRIGPATALYLLEQVAERGDQMRRTGKADPFVYAAHELAQKLQESAKLDHLDTLRNARIRNGVLDQVRTAGGIGAAETTLRSILHGTNIGGRDSIERAWKSRTDLAQAQLEWQLKKAGLLKVALSGSLDGQVAHELWAMNTLGPERMGRLSPARQIAEAIKPILDDAKARLNAAGARIGDAYDYVAHTAHDPEKIRRAAGPGKTPDQGFVAWWKATEPRLAAATFDSVTPREGETMAQARTRFGRSVYEALITGVHMTPDGKAVVTQGPGGYIPPAFEGTGNLAKRLSQPRVLRWKDAEAWHGYMQQFGAPHSLTEGIYQTIDQSARHLAMLERLGTNPAGNLNLITRRIEETYRGDLDGLAKFQAKIPGIDAVMAHLDGRANIPANKMWARLGSGVRTWESMSSLGGVGVTHFAGAWMTLPSELSHHGVSRLAAIGNFARALLKGRGSAERQETMAELGAYANGLARDMHARFHADDALPGKISAIAGRYMSATGIHYVYDTAQAATREMLANELARNVGNAYGALKPALAQMLGKYGIGPEEWELLRAVPNLRVADGMAYMTPRDALRVDPTATRILLRNRGTIAATADKASAGAIGDRFAQSLADRLNSYYSDAAAHAVVTPGVRERAFALGKDRPGSLWGELRRYVAQFKMWPLAAMNQVIGREIHMSLSRGKAAWNIGMLMVLALPAGYLRMVVNDYALGHPLRDPRNPATLFATLAQSGGLGIFGDFLFGQVSRMGGSLAGTVAGPVYSDADQLWQIYNRFRADAGDLQQGQVHHRDKQPFSDLWPDLAHLAVRHIPFANLVYLKGALDYLLWYHLYEAASPGWWERTNRRLTREQGRAMTGYAPGQGVPWTPWGLGGSEAPAVPSPAPALPGSPAPRASGAPIAMPRLD